MFAYSSKREQSNERSGTRLKTESETGEIRHALPISLLILRKKPTVLQSRVDQTLDSTIHRINHYPMDKC